MSEIRKVDANLTDISFIEEACSDLNISFIKDGERIVLKNHGVKTWYGTDITLEKQENNSYLLVGDCNLNDLKELSIKIKVIYSSKKIIKESKKMNFELVERKKENGKIKLRLRSFD